MTWRESTIAHCKQSITKLRDRIDRMRAGTFEVRELEHGKSITVSLRKMKRRLQTLRKL